MAPRLVSSHEELAASFNRAYLSSVDYGFQALGSQVSSVVINYMDRKYGVRLAETAEKPELLSEALDRVLGFGALLIKRRILKNLRAQLPPSGESPIESSSGQDFPASVREIRRRCEAAHQARHQ